MNLSNKFANSTFPGFWLVISFCIWKSKLSQDSHEILKNLRFLVISERYFFFTYAGPWIHGEIWESFLFFRFPSQVELSGQVGAFRVKSVLSESSRCFPSQVGAFRVKSVLSESSRCFPSQVELFESSRASRVKSVLFESSRCFSSQVGAFRSTNRYFPTNQSIFSDQSINSAPFPCIF